MNVSDLPDDSDLLFVYGTLRQSGHDALHPKAQFLQGQSTYIGKGLVRGKLYRIDYYPALALDDKEDHVIGDIVRMHDPDSVFPELDAFEEYGPDFAKPWEFRRVILPVETDGVSLAAWAYAYNWPVVGLPLIKSGDWLKG
tara:strand:+ start:248 stop:670 length:423 start_codon:yes stop_codon:yes gene_type:complete